MSGQVAKAAPGEVIKAARMFTKNGRSKQVSLVTELSVGLGLGIGAGLVWKVSGFVNWRNLHFPLSGLTLHLLGRYTTGTRRERSENTIRHWPSCKRRKSRRLVEKANVGLQALG